MTNMDKSPAPQGEVAAELASLRRAVETLGARLDAVEGAGPAARGADRIAATVQDARFRAGSAWQALRGRDPATEPPAGTAIPAVRGSFLGTLVMVVLALAGLLLAVEVLDEIF